MQSTNPFNRNKRITVQPDFLAIARSNLIAKLGSALEHGLDPGGVTQGQKSA
jgi:hypothetical protein